MFTIFVLIFGYKLAYNVTYKTHNRLYRDYFVFRILTWYQSKSKSLYEFFFSNRIFFQTSQQPRTPTVLITHSIEIPATKHKHKPHFTGTKPQSTDSTERIWVFFPDIFVFRIEFIWRLNPRNLYTYCRNHTDIQYPH